MHINKTSKKAANVKKSNGFIFCEQISLKTETNNFLKNQLTCKNVTQSSIDILQLLCYQLSHFLYIKV